MFWSKNLCSIYIYRYGIFIKKRIVVLHISLERLQLVHERIDGKLPLIGVGNLFSAEQILAAYQTGWAEFIALGKTVMIIFAILLQSTIRSMLFLCLWGNGE